MLYARKIEVHRGHIHVHVHVHGHILALPLQMVTGVQMMEVFPNSDIELPAHRVHPARQVPRTPSVFIQIPHAVLTGRIVTVRLIWWPGSRSWMV
ncbi:hypothetical protein N7454_005285 [Penicillium verhagenii]|nr:hypothetical protein N7454_005285 [Penicillium verhagenii]